MEIPKTGKAHEFMGGQARVSREILDPCTGRVVYGRLPVLLLCGYVCETPACSAF